MAGARSNRATRARLGLGLTLTSTAAVALGIFFASRRADASVAPPLQRYPLVPPTPMESPAPAQPPETTDDPGPSWEPSRPGDAPTPGVDEPTSPPLASVPLLHIDGIDVYQEGKVLRWSGDLAIDYDGAPNAYAPVGFGQPLDNLADAGHPGNWWGIVTDSHGKPALQTSGPYTGYYISTTALRWRGKTGIQRYVDSTTIPFIALPPVFKDLGAQLGDLALVASERTGAACWAIFADIGPRKKLGEGSWCLAQKLGVPESRDRKNGIRVQLYLGSGDGQPHLDADIQARGAQLAAEVT